MKTNFKLICWILAVGFLVCCAIKPIQISLAKPGAQKLGPDKNLLAVEDWYLQTEDKAAFLYIKEVGKGVPVVVIHGGPGADHRYMLAITKGLDHQFRFIFYDQRGCGLSFCAKENISMERSIQDLETIRKGLGVDKINLVSHSAGTYLAMNYLQTYPQNVAHIVLLGALDPKNGNRAFFTPEELVGFGKRNNEVKSFNERQEVQAEIKKTGLERPNLTPKEEFQLRRIKSAAGSIYHIERWRQNVFFIANKDAAQAMRASTNLTYDWSKTLAGHPFPITVINGEYDLIVGSKGSPIWKRVIATETKNVELVLLDKAGHNSWIDDPIAFRNSLRAALPRKR